MRSLASTLLLLVLALFLSGCRGDAALSSHGNGGPGSEGGASDTGDFSELERYFSELDRTGLPDCSGVWVEGATLPRDYEGCVDERGLLELATFLICEDPSKEEWRLATNRDDLWALAGHTIHRAAGGNVDAEAGRRTRAYCTRDKAGAGS